MSFPPTDPAGPGARPGRLGVGVVGAGRVGAVLASALRGVGHAVVGATAVSAESRDRVDALLPGVPVLGIEEVVERAELVLLTVPDDVLAELVRGLADLGRWQPGQLVVHTSGRYGTEVLAPARAAGAITLAIHPAMTFTGTSLDISRLTGCPFAVTAAAPVLPIAQALVVEIGGEPVVLAEEDRPVYHAALAHGANHLVTLVAQAERTLAAAGLTEPGAYLAPLLSAALDGAVRSGEQSLTGPVVRGDAGTVEAHLAALGGLGEELTDVVDTYRHLARATTRRALTTGRLAEAPAARLLDVLAAGDSESGPGGPAAAASAAGAGAGPRTTAEPGTTASAGTTAEARPPAAGAPAVGAPATPLEPVVVRSRTELRAALAALPGTRALVMTMGALHDGHLALVREARARASHVVVSIYVNPLQFGPGEDFEAYPRDLDADVALLAREGVDLVLAPSDEEAYPAEPLVRIDPGPVAGVLEGRTRPGHFAGVLQIVAKVLNLVRPDVAVFGEKDAQQLALVRTLVRDLDLGVEIVGVPIRREEDGLAMSSRNAYLSAQERRRALALSRALAAGRDAGAAGGGAADVLRAAEAVLGSAEGVEVDYLALVDPDTFLPLDEGAVGAGLLAVAARVGTTRLIDNMTVDLRGPRP
ncbi:pantoate--beta-alanine ligase [Georgenia daeguensis]|uniref:Pantothenate synthetase n=1 Tax=Georgenia daeguensis TaxID=908355 RepID=A0ABP8ETE0_9MICO